MTAIAMMGTNLDATLRTEQPEPATTHLRLHGWQSGPLPTSHKTIRTRRAQSSEETETAALPLIVSWKSGRLLVRINRLHDKISLG